MEIDLNADLGESFGPWKMGNDAEVLSVVTSANVACGFHAGDPLQMRMTVRTCIEKNVGIGAHPGFNDLVGFGRREVFGIGEDELKAMVIYQIGAIHAIAKAEKSNVRHVKMHGALANMASRDMRLARTVVSAVKEADLGLAIIAIAATCLERAAQELEVPYAGEIFADRAYNDDGTLVSRSEPGAMIHDPELCADNILRTVESGALTSRNGVKVPVNAHTVCVHGDTPEAVAIASTVRGRLEQRGIKVRRFSAGR